ncbi:MAG: hydroxymethylpyrimidine/phosphomethylpyrimidine kinase, partial [Selenomonadaceae bacterium]|nr:hydroxymethylpyrimidine/phosphomethylpyrimidine kinase [Selenomonadaceae bacterium]
PQHIVLDPVMVATSGSKLIADDARDELTNLFPLAEVITPNMFELAALTDQPIDAIKDKDDMELAARKLFERYGCAVLAKGGHFKSVATDLLCSADGFQWFYGEHVETKNTHGTGCTLSSAIAANLAKGKSLSQSIERAKKFLTGALSSRLSIGHGSGPLDHGFMI